MLKEKLKGSGIKLAATVTTLGTVVYSTAITAHADQITSQDASTVASKIFVANKGIATTFGGSLIGIAVVVIGIKMLMASKKQEARSEAMDSILTVIIASLLIGGFAVFAGLFYGFGQ